MTSKEFEPRIIGFFCNWCSYRAADSAGGARRKHAQSVRVIRVMCSGRVEPDHVLAAFAGGADGVLIAGCHPGECHYKEQNFKTLRRVAMLRPLLRSLGIEAPRLRLQWASAAEGPQLAAAIDEMTEDLRELGPLNWKQRTETDVSRGRSVLLHAEEHAESQEVQA